MKKKKKTLQELKDMLNDDIDEMLKICIMEQIKELDEVGDEKICSPLRERILSLKPKLESINAWPVTMVVHFSFGHDWLHGHEGKINFEKQIIEYSESSTQRPEFIKQYSSPNALHPKNDFYLISKQLQGKNNFDTVTVQQYLKMFKPGARQNISFFQDSYKEKNDGPVFFIEQLVCCPLCSRIHNKKFHESVDGQSLYNRHPMNTQQDLGFYHLGAGGPEYRFEKIIEVAEKIVNGKFFDNGMVFRRCESCKKLSYMDHWKKIYKSAKEQATRSPAYISMGKKQEAIDLLQNLSRLYPDKFKIKIAIKKSILRRAKKIKKIRPLSKGEIIFFSMNLAAAEIKKLKLEN